MTRSARFRARWPRRCCVTRDRAQAGRARRLEAPARILNRHALGRLRAASPIAAASSATASRYGSGAGLLAGVSSAATIAAKYRVELRRARARVGSLRASAPDAIAIGTAAAARRIAALRRRERGPTCRARAPRAAPALRATRARDVLARPRADRDPRRSPRTPRHRRSRGSARSSRAPSSATPSSASTSRNAAEVQRLAVGDDAVEVEDDRAKHHFAFRLLHSLAGAHRNLQAVLRRRIRAVVGRVVVAVRDDTRG